MRLLLQTFSVDHEPFLKIKTYIYIIVLYMVTYNVFIAFAKQCSCAQNIDNNGTMVRRRRQSPSFIIEIRILINQIGRSNFEEENSNTQVEEKTTFLKRTRFLQVDPAKNK